MYEDVSGSTYNLRHRLKIGEFQRACGCIGWNSAPQGDELRGIWFKGREFSPRVHQYLQGFLRSKRL